MVDSNYDSKLNCDAIKVGMALTNDALKDAFTTASLLYLQLLYFIRLKPFESGVE